CEPTSRSPIPRVPASIRRRFRRSPHSKPAASSTYRAILRRSHATSVTSPSAGIVPNGCSRSTCFPRRRTSRSSPVSRGRDDPARPHDRSGPSPVKGYVVRRLGQSFLVLFGISFVVFLILHLTGDPALVLLPPDASVDDVKRFRQEMGFNDAFLVQYG